MQRMNPWQRFYWKQALSSKMGQFGPRYLDLNLKEHGGPVEFLEATRDRSLCRARLPRWAARPDGSAPLGALLAILDQCSTFGGLAEFSPDGRTGVSISLSGEVEAGASLAAGELVTVETRLLKQGRTLAFLACDVYAGERRLVSGRHAKFLNLGARHDLFIHSPLRHVTLPILERLADRDPPTAYEGDAEGLGPDDVFALGADGAMDVTTAHCNGIGGLHGGAACMIAEHAAATSRPGVGAATSLSCTLMSALRAGQTAAVSTRWKEGARPAADVLISDAKTGAPCYDVALAFS